MTPRPRKIEPTPARVQKMLDMHRAIIARAEAQIAESREAIAVLERLLANHGRDAGG